MLSGIQLVLAGLGIGLLMAAPIGPVNVLVIQRAVAKGFWGGLAAGIGAVLGDGVLAAVGAFSVAAISDVMLAHGDTIQVVGGALLVAFGLALLLRKPVMTTPPHERSHLLEHMGIIPQTFILTVTNPGAVLGMGIVALAVHLHLYYLLAQMLATVLVMGFTFTLNRWWTFR